MDQPTREAAWELLCRYNETEKLRTHALAVEGVMRHFAKRAGEDEELWGIVGLLHDLDYEKYPEEHCLMTEKILQDEGWPEEIIRAVKSHGWEICTDVEPQSLMERTLYAIDELTGLVAASALVRPSRSVMDLPVKSVKKKMKDKSFAAGVDRTVVARGAELLGMEMTDLIDETIKGMQSVAEELNLA